MDHDNDNDNDHDHDHVAGVMYGDGPRAALATCRESILGDKLTVFLLVTFSNPTPTLPLYVMN